MEHWSLDWDVRPITYPDMSGKYDPNICIITIYTHELGVVEYPFLYKY